jgi:uncharacterized protein YgfB (UPF0149 family)
MPTTIDYPELRQLLSDAHAVTGPAEAHGSLVGSLCAVNGFSLDDWLSEILPEGEIATSTEHILGEMYRQTVGALLGADMQFELLLPDESESLEERARSLGLWCNGFLYGLGTNGAKDPRELPTDAAEVVQDLGEISRAGVDLQDSEESNEVAYTELVEFVRVGVQLVFEELGQRRAPPPPPSVAGPKTLH